MNQQVLIKHIQQEILASIQAKQLLIEQCCPDILKAAQMMTSAFQSRNKILFCGNGGSAADSQHFATEFVVRLNQKSNRKALPAMALTTDTSLLTACSNDFGFDSVFVRQMEALAVQGDILVGISTSGNSANIVRAFDYAKNNHIQTILLSGSTGGLLSAYSTCQILVPSIETTRIQECHLMIGHILVELVEILLFNK